MDASFVGVHGSPSIYKIRLDKPSELLNLFQHEILLDIPVNEVEAAMSRYVTEIIEPTEWRAVWRPTSRYSKYTLNCDFEVKVVDVSLTSLEAVVVVVSLIGTPEHLPNEQYEMVQRLLNEDKIHNCPLMELYVISEDDDEGIYLKTAMVIEYIRFFYNYIWRPWDGIIFNSSPAKDVFVESRLLPRLNLYFDIKQQTLSEATINRIKSLLKEGWMIRSKIDELSVLLDLNDTDDLGNGVDEGEVYRAMRLRLRLEDIERDMKMLEDPYLRCVASLTNTLNDQEEFENVENTSGKIHVVAKSFTLSSTCQILESIKATETLDKPISFHSNFVKAINSSKTGDKIYISPGIYMCDALPWIEYDIEVRGLSLSNKDVIIHSADSVGDIFLNCNAEQILLENLTIRTTVETQCIVMIHSGKTLLKNCILDGGNCARNGLIVLSKAQAKIEDCNIMHSPKNSGIISRPGGDVIIENEGKDVMMITEPSDNEESCKELVTNCS